MSSSSGVDSRGAGDARAPPEFEGSEKGRSLISAIRSLAITASTPGFEKLSTALPLNSHVHGPLDVCSCIHGLFDGLGCVHGRSQPFDLHGPVQTPLAESRTLFTS